MPATPKTRVRKPQEPIPEMDLECPRCNGVEIEDTSPGLITRRVIGHSEGEPIFVFERYELDAEDWSYCCADCGKRSKNLGTFVRSDDALTPF